MSQSRHASRPVGGSGAWRRLALTGSGSGYERGSVCGVCVCVCVCVYVCVHM